MGQGLSVRGTQLLVGGAPFTVQGVQIVGLVAPNRALRGEYAVAHQHFSAAELRKAIGYHVNTVRFQVSQYGLDPRSPLYSPAYVTEVIKAVRLARELGLVVIITVQAQAPAGMIEFCPLPDAGTLRVWNELAPVFKQDRGVMFELYNEPAVAATPAGWRVWRDGGTVIGPDGISCTAIGMQSLINAIRADGAKNVIIVPGLDFERTLAGMPPVTDPASRLNPQLAYGIHDPPLSAPAAWQYEFGEASTHVPVIVTEWNPSAESSGCDPAAPVQAPALLRYLLAHHIGVVGYAFDLPGTLITGWSYQPTSYGNFSCGHLTGGPGLLLFSTFAAADRRQG
jgi:endoglucanase